MSFMKSVQERLTGKSGGQQPTPEAARGDAIRENLRSVMDPDLHKDIVSLGFVKEIKVAGAEATITVELTTPACPVKEKLRGEVEQAALSVPGISEVRVHMTAQTRKGQAAISEQASMALGQVRNIVAVASGKGGVGKSTTAVNLAFALAQAGAKVGIMDADIYGPSVQLMTKAEQPTEMVGNLIEPTEVSGIKVISIAMFAQAGQAALMRGPMAAQVIKQFLTQVAWGELDYLLIDYPPGTGDIQLTLSQIAPITGAVVVTTPQEVALLDVRKAVSMFNTLRVPILGVVETMSYFICDGCEKKHHIFRTGGGERLAAEHGVPLLGAIPIDPRVADTGDTGTPIVAAHTDSTVSQAYRDAAGKVAAQLSILNNATGGDALNYFTLEWKA